MVEGIDEDKITAEIEDLQHKLGDLQSNIDKVLQEVENFHTAPGKPSKGQMFLFFSGKGQAEEKEKRGQV